MWKKFFGIGAVIASMIVTDRAAAQFVFYVDGDDGSDANDGLSWETAFETIQHAISQCNDNSLEAPDTIWVREGTYICGADEDESFDLDRNLRLIGGFNGNEDDEAFINPVQNLTILSGEIPMVGRAWHVLWSLNMPWNTETHIIGFTITAGEAEYDLAEPYGGAFWTESGIADGPLFKTCRFVDNSAAQGGAIATRTVNMEFRDCVFLDNVAETTGGAISANSGMTFSKCE